MRIHGDKLIRVTALIGVVGLSLVVSSTVIAETSKVERHSPGDIAITLLRELGMAFTVASVVALAVETLLSKERIRGIVQLLSRWRDADELGFSRVYPNRQDVFHELIDESIPEAEHKIRVMGICVSLFKEAERRVEGHPDPAKSEQLVKVFCERIMAGCHVQVLNLCRYPNENQRQEYALDKQNLYFWREHDEDAEDSPQFQRGDRLLKIANEAQGRWIHLLVSLAEASVKKSEVERRNILFRLAVKEYVALPSISVYIVDDQLYFTPYLFRRHCRDVPSFAIQGEDKKLFQEYAGHFDATWRDALTTDAIPAKFIQLLAAKPRQTIEGYQTSLNELRVEQKKQLQRMDARARPEHQQSPGYSQLEENAIRRYLEKVTVPAVGDQPSA